MITRIYTAYKDKSNVPFYITKLKSLMQGRNITKVEGHKTRIGIGNDLLNNSKSIKRILCPTKNAFKLYDKILILFKKLTKKI